MALRGGGTAPASMNDHAYLYANMFDKSIMYDLAVLWLAIPGGGPPTEGLFGPHPIPPGLCLQLPFPIATNF